MSETTSNIYEQLAKAQAEFGEIAKTKDGQIGNLPFKYAPLDEVYEKTRPVLNKYGIFHNHDLAEVDEYNTLVTCNLHYAGQSISPCSLRAHHDGTAGGKGKAITYMARYTYQRAIGVIGEEDTDAQGLGPGGKKAEPQEKRGQQKKQQQTNGSAKPPANTEKKSIIDKIKDKIAAAVDPAELVSIYQNAIKSWPDKTEFLGLIYDACLDESRGRVAKAYVYDNAGKSQQWDEDDRKWVFAELTKIQEANGKPAPQAEQTQEAEPADWSARIKAVTKSDQLFSLISEAADDGNLTSDPDEFSLVCGALAAAIDAHAKEWGEGVVNISRQHLQQRITAVELDRQAKEAMSNG